MEWGKHGFLHEHSIFDDRVGGIGILMVLFIGFTLLKIFLGNPLLVGCSRFFLENSDRKLDLD